MERSLQPPVEAKDLKRFCSPEADLQKAEG
jgi:hypothetical protein